MNRVLKPGGYFIYISYAEPGRRERYLTRNGWSIQHYKLYRTCLEEEKLMMERQFYGEEEHSDPKELDPESFDAVLKRNMTPSDLGQYRFTTFHYAYVCRKPLSSVPVHLEEPNVLNE
jgi:hypothetical protein